MTPRPPSNFDNAQAAWTQRAPRPSSVRQRASVERLSPPAKRAGSHHVARRLQFDMSPQGREPPRRRVRSLSRRARFPSVEVVCIPQEPRRDDLQDDEDAERDRLEPHWNSYAAYDLARQTVDISIFRRAHEFDSDTDSSFSLSTDGFWERRSTFEQWLLVLCASVVLSTCVTLTYTFYYAREYGKAERLKQVGIEYYDCQTQMCKDAAIELKDTLNLNKDPCKNFYEYVCSLWPNRYPVPDDMGHYSVQDYVRDEVAKRIFATLRKGPLDVDQRFGDEITAMRLFYSCYNLRGRQHEGLLPLTRVMRGLSLSEWPYELGERLPRARFVLQRLSVDYGLPFFVSLNAVPDPRDARATLLAVDLGEPLLHANFVVSRDADEYRALLRVHATYVRRTMALMGAHDMASTVTADVHDYEFALAELSNYQTLRELTEFNSDNIVTLDQLQSGATLGRESIDNTSLIEPTKELLASIVRQIYQRSGVPTRYNEEILVWNISTFHVLDKFLASENRRMLLNYLGWRVVALLGPATTAEMLNARHAFHMAKFGAEDQPQLLSFCFDQAAKMLPVAVGRMAFRATGAGDSGQTQRLVARMVEEIRASLLLLLRGSDVSWLNEQSKEVAINKIRRLKLIQQPVNSTVLEWEPPELHPESSFGTNVAILLSAKAEHNWKRLGKYNYLDSVPVPQLRMSVSYDVYRNAIVVPAILTGLGLSTPGLLAVDLSPSINFGTFGYLVAHEMLRSIMFSGSVIDADGNFRNWHFRDTPAKFRILVNCFESMFRRTITNELMRRVRASSVALSQMLSRELVIGSTALPAAFKAYRTFMARYEGESEFSSLPRVRFSQNQLFFLYFAKSWCHTRRRIYESYYIEDTNQPPPDLRVNHILMDFEKFGKTFDCQLGDIMTPHFKCSTW